MQRPHCGGTVIGYQCRQTLAGHGFPLLPGKNRCTIARALAVPVQIRHADRVPGPVEALGEQLNFQRIAAQSVQ